MPLGYILTISEVIDYYTEREDIQRILLAHGSHRKCTCGTDTGMFGDRGNTLTQPSQIAEMMERHLEKQISAVPRKYPAFHAKITREGVNGGRDTMTDFIIDIDIKDNQKAAFREGRKVLDLLDSYEVPYRVKFSGHASPHIFLPGEMFPPGLGKRGWGHVQGKLMEFIQRKARPTNVDGSFNSPDHYLRMPYSLNEHTGLVSVPIAEGGYDDFHVEMAEAQNVVVQDDWMAIPHRGGMDSLLAAAGLGG